MTNQSPRWRVGQAPTIYDVARECGVAPSTVSRAFSRPGRVNAETAERIRAAAARMGYRTNPPARALSTGRSSMVALVIPDVTNPVYFDITRAAEAGYTLLLADFRETGQLERKAIDRAVPAVEGLVLGGPRISDSAIRMAAKQRPTVILNRVVTGLASVVIDNPLRQPATAVVAYNDLMAIGLMHGLRRARVPVPRQVSVVGFDNIFGSDFCTPALTTVAAPLRALGAAGVRRLLAQLGGAKARPAQPEVLPVRLVVRASTAQRSRKRSSPARGTTSVSGSAAQASGSTAAGSR